MPVRGRARARQAGRPRRPRTRRSSDARCAARSSAARRLPHASSTFTTAGGRRLAREQPSLGVEVALHRAVEVEVVLRQVGEHERREAHAVEPAAAPSRARSPRWRSCGRRRRASRLNARCRSIDSGVVRTAGSALAADRGSRSCRGARVAVRPRRAPRGRGTPSSSCRSCPSRRRPGARRSGRPKNSSAARAIATRASGTTS